MIEYSKNLEEYLTHWHSSFTKLIPKKEWGNKELAEKYLEKYWLHEHEYHQVWKPIQHSIFQNKKIYLPANIFQKEFTAMGMRGGCLFDKNDFEALQKIILAIGDKNIIIIQNDFEGAVETPLFKMKYPAHITWEEFISGNYISAILVESWVNEYFIFSESGTWGKYSASDYIIALDIIGCNPKLSSTFLKYFQPLDSSEWSEIRESIPQEYIGEYDKLRKWLM